MIVLEVIFRLLCEAELILEYIIKTTTGNRKE